MESKTGLKSVKYPSAMAWKSCWTLVEREQDWEQLAFPISHFSSTDPQHWVLSLYITPCIPYSLTAWVFGSSSSLMHAALLNICFASFSDQNVFKLCTMLCMNVMCYMCVFVCLGKLDKSVHDCVNAYPCEPLLLLACCLALLNPEAKQHARSKRGSLLACYLASHLCEKAAWMTKSEVSQWRQLQQQNQLKHTIQALCLRACKSQGQAFPLWSEVTVWEGCHMKEQQT